MEIKSRFDISQLFWEVDELCKKLELYQSPQLQLETDKPAKPYRSRFSLSEVATIVIAFQVSGNRTFKDFYTFQVQPYWRKAFPPASQLQPLCGTDALEHNRAGLSARTLPGRSDWY